MLLYVIKASIYLFNKCHNENLRYRCNNNSLFLIRGSNISLNQIYLRKISPTYRRISSHLISVAVLMDLAEVTSNPWHGLVNNTDVAWAQAV
jgi:hypothetical protein